MLRGEQKSLDIFEDIRPDLLILLSYFLASDVEIVMEKEAEAVPNTHNSPPTQATSIGESEGATLGRITNHKNGDCAEIPNAPLTVYCNGFISSLSGSQSELKALIEKEVREHMMHLSGQLDQRMKEIADQHNSALDSPQPNPRDKK